MNVRELILSTDDLPSERVYVPEWGVSLLVMTMTAEEKDRFDAMIESLPSKEKKLDNFRSNLLVRCLADLEGNLIFAPADASLLGKKSAAVVARLFDVASRLNLLSKEDVDKALKN